jgi:hypothetical protein
MDSWVLVTEIMLIGIAVPDRNPVLDYWTIAGMPLNISRI